MKHLTAILQGALADKLDIFNKESEFYVEEPMVNVIYNKKTGSHEILIDGLLYDVANYHWTYKMFEGVRDTIEKFAFILGYDDYERYSSSRFILYNH